jgi:hypothetical protein
MKKIIGETAFFLIAAVVILPTPTLLFAWMTGKTITQVLYQ